MNEFCSCNHHTMQSKYFQQNENMEVPQSGLAKLMMWANYSY